MVVLEVVRTIEVNNHPLVLRGKKRGWFVYTLPERWDRTKPPFELWTKQEILKQGITAGPFMLKIYPDQLKVMVYPYPVPGNYPKLEITTSSYFAEEKIPVERCVDDDKTIYVGLSGREYKSCYVYLVRLVD